MPLKFDLQPLVGVADLKFGMNRSESRALMKNEFSAKPTDGRDYYFDNSFQLFFNGQGKLKFIEISRDENIEAIFMEKNVLQIPASVLINEVTQYFASNSHFGLRYVSSIVQPIFDGAAKSII